MFFIVQYLFTRYRLNNWPIQALNYVCSLILERQIEAEIKAVARNIHDYRIRRDAQRFVSHTTDLSSSTDPSNTSVQMIDIPKELCEVYERKKIGQPVTLTGPYLPLEANHSSCHYATKMRRVQIDGESINSVGLEEEQHCNYRRLLVSFGVHLSQTRQIVLLRHTTLIPSIRVLPALIAMIFAPTN
ncbi:unnamed protein product [Rotaria sp. Silwood2]|nr:unnamed protein product [Rotaria sp. Silwood2]